MTTLAGKRILVTGATGVLGGLMSAHIVAMGGTVVHSARNTERLAALATTDEKFGVDMTVPTAGAALISAVTDSGPLDGIVFAHGVVAFGPAASVTADTLSEITATNLTSVIETITAAVPALLQSAAAGNEPFVVTLSGVISENAVAGMAVYGATKSGLRAYIEAVARELRRDKIRVFDARPPHTETGLATRAIAGTAPAFPAGLAPEAVAQRIIDAILNDEKDVPSTAFAG